MTQNSNNFIVDSGLADIKDQALKNLMCAKTMSKRAQKESANSPEDKDLKLTAAAHIRAFEVLKRLYQEEDKSINKLIRFMHQKELMGYFSFLLQNIYMRYYHRPKTLATPATRKIKQAIGHIKKIVEDSRQDNEVSGVLEYAFSQIMSERFIPNAVFIRSHYPKADCSSDEFNDFAKNIYKQFSLQTVISLFGQEVEKVHDQGGAYNNYSREIQSKSFEKGYFAEAYFKLIEKVLGTEDNEKTVDLLQIVKPELFIDFTEEDLREILRIR